MTEANGQHATETTDAERRLSTSVRRTLETARAIEARGGVVSMASVAKERGISVGTASKHRMAIEAGGLWPWPNVRAGRPRLEARPTPTTPSGLDACAMKTAAI